MLAALWTGPCQPAISSDKGSGATGWRKEHEPPWQLRGYAPMERLFRSLKFEWIPALGYRKLPEATKDVSSYLMGYYNQQRPHTFNNGISPVAAEENLKLLSNIS